MVKLILSTAKEPFYVYIDRPSFTLLYAAKFLERYHYYLQIGGSIPSFRQILQIGKLNWSLFKKILPSKKDKQEFDKVIYSVRLHVSYLGNELNLS